MLHELFPPTITTVETGLTTLIEVVESGGMDRAFQVFNTGGTALNAFQVQARVSIDAPWVILKSTDFTGEPPETFPVWATSNPVTLADGASTIIQVAGVYRFIRLQASVASGSTTVAIYGVG